VKWFWDSFWWVVKPHDHDEHDPSQEERNSKAKAGAEPLERPGARRLHHPYDWHEGLNGDG
jgi:hypothetical protein